MTTICRENGPTTTETRAPATPETGTSRRIPGADAEKRPVPRLALSKAEASEAIGCSVDFLEEHVLPELRVVRRGRRVFVAVAELERWLRDEAALTLGERW